MLWSCKPQVDNDSGEHVRGMQGHPRGSVSFSPDGREIRSLPSAAAAAATASISGGNHDSRRHGKNSAASGERAWDVVVSGELVRGTLDAVVWDHNMRAMYLHVLADTLGSVGATFSPTS